MIPLGTVFGQCKCPKCGLTSCSIVTTMVTDFGTRIRKVVFDACPKCGTRVTNIEGFERDLTEEELKELYPRLFKDKER